MSTVARPSTGFVWEIRVPGTDYLMRTDDFTLDEIESIEDQTQVPWLALSPTQWKVARAMLVVAMIRSGIPDDEIGDLLKGWRIGDIDGVFTLIPPRKLAAVTDKKTQAVDVPPTAASS